MIRENVFVCECLSPRVNFRTPPPSPPDKFRFSHGRSPTRPERAEVGCVRTGPEDPRPPLPTPHPFLRAARPVVLAVQEPLSFGQCRRRCYRTHMTHL